MALFARLGLPAPREAHTRLYVNGEYAGLYSIVEAVDKVFLDRALRAEQRLSLRIRLRPRGCAVSLRVPRPRPRVVFAQAVPAGDARARSRSAAARRDGPRHQCPRGGGLHAGAVAVPRSGGVRPPCRRRSVPRRDRRRAGRLGNEQLLPVPLRAHHAFNAWFHGTRARPSRAAPRRASGATSTTSRPIARTC